MGGLGFYTSYNLAIKYLPLSIHTIVSNTTPFWNMLIGYVLFKEGISRFDLFCIVGSFTGIVIMSLGKDSENKFSMNIIIGILFGLASAFMMAALSQVNHELKK